MGESELAGKRLSQEELLRRFWSKIQRTDYCWEWTGATCRGYGRARWLDGEWKAHRLSYTLFVGEIPDGLHIDHLCRNPGCVRPDHLEPVSCAENIRRGCTGYIERAKISCPAGHRYDDKNTYRPARGGRQCRECHKKAERDRRRRLSLARVGPALQVPVQSESIHHAAVGRPELGSVELA